MPEPTRHSVDAILGERARGDARRISPGFSSALHARIIGSVLALEFQGGGFPAARRRVGRPRAARMAMAAAVAILVGPTLLTYRSTRPALSSRSGVEESQPQRGAVQYRQVALFSTAHEMNSKVQEAVQTAMAEEKFAGLDHDVRAATEYLVDQLPLRSAWEPGGAAVPR